MNKLYRTVFNEKTNTWVAVSEVTKAHGKSGVSSNVVSTVLDSVLFDKKMLAVSIAVVAALTSQTAMAADARIENGSAQSTIAISPSDSTAATGSAKADGMTSIAAGWNASAKANHSIAIGTNASVDAGTATTYPGTVTGTVTGVGSVAVGADSAAKGTNAAAFGQKSEAFGQNSLAAGQDSHATGKSSVALGDGAKGSQDSATAVGVYAKASGAGATAIGGSTKAETWGATALGLSAKAHTNSSTTAIGHAAEATGSSATAVGATAEAEGNNAAAVGNGSKAAGASAFAAGHGAEAGAANSVSVGLNAGKGASNNTRTVAIGDSAAINSNGNNNVAVGTQAMNGYEGNASIGIGEQAGLESKGQHNTVIGWTAGRHLDGDDNIAIGTRANDATTAATPRTVTKVTNTVALGSDTQATVNGSVALGNKSVASTDAGVKGADPLSAVTDKNNATWTSTAAAVSVGDVTNKITRQITGVAAGKEDTDVVNVAQLKAVASQITQTPVVYIDANGNKVYKRPDGKFYDALTGGNVVAPGNVIASMQDAAGSITNPTTLANVNSNLADAAAAKTNPANNDRTALTANNKGNNAATVKDVLNAGFTVQGNGTAKDFVTHGDTINFADGRGTVANVSTKNGETTVKFDTPMTYVDSTTGAPTNTASNKVNLVGGDTSKPVTLGNVAPGEISATSTDAVNGSQLYNVINNSVGNVAGAVENLQNRMGKLQDDSEAGTASALAAAGLPQAYLPGKSMIAVSGSTYRGQQGYAVGMSAISDGGNWIVKGIATGNSRGHFGATIGAGYQW